MAEESDEAGDDGTRFGQVLAGARDVLRGIFHSRHLYRPPEE